VYFPSRSCGFGLKKARNNPAKKRAEPYNKHVGELPDMRRETLILIKSAVAHNRQAYVLVNNRLEGNAPLTVQALTDLLKGG